MFTICWVSGMKDLMPCYETCCETPLLLKVTLNGDFVAVIAVVMYRVKLLCMYIQGLLLACVGSKGTDA